MSAEWQTVEIGSLCAGIYDGPHATPKKTTEGPVFLGISSLNSGQLDLSSLEYLSEEDFSKWTKRVVPQAGDIVFSYETRLGQVAVIPEGLRCCLGRRMALMRVNPEKAIPDYLLYAFLSPDFQDVIRQRTIHGSTVDRIPLVEFGSFPISVPPLDVQRNVVATLRALDDRITLLRETNATLEAIAQALFKSWFVDFDPVRAKLEGRAAEGMDEATARLFPDNFEESELGLVPRGWRVSSCQDLFEVRDGTHESPKPSLEGYPLVTSKHITSGRVNLQDTYLISEADYAAISKRSKVNRLDVLITMIGTVGLSSILLDAQNDFAIKNIGLFKTSQAPNFAYFLSLLLKSPKMQEYLAARLAGTTQKYLSLTALREMRVLVPSEPTLTEFSKLAATLFDGIHRNHEQAQTLATLRDTLLPRLISGALRLDGVA